MMFQRRAPSHFCPKMMPFCFWSLQMMTRRVISLIREAGSQTAARHPHRDLPGRSRGAQLRRSFGDGGLLNVTSQVAWQKDINIGPRLPPVEYHRHHDDDRGRVSRSWQFPQRGNRVQPLDSDVTDDVDRRERRRHKRAHRKHRRHRREQQQALVSSGHRSAWRHDLMCRKHCRVITAVIFVAKLLRLTWEVSNYCLRDASVYQC